MNVPRAIALLCVMLVAGCASWRAASEAWFGERPDLLLVRADQELAAEDYELAVRLYDRFLQLHADAAATNRVRATKTALVRLLETQGELERARAARAAGEQALAERQRELETLRAGLDRMRSERELARIEAERVKADRDRLRDALERLRAIDLSAPRVRPSDLEGADQRR
jgi:hypothetical protein